MREWIATFGGAGKSPVAPGTVGSFATAAIIYLVHVVWRQDATPSSIDFNIFLLVFMLLACVAAVQLGPWAFEYYRRKDPGPFVLDEVAGVCLTMLCLPVMPDARRELWVVLCAFAAFRVFDVWKPPPCPQLERLPAGWGILMDDLMAAVYANVCCQIVTRIVLHY